jgi:hypothetical protein
MRSQLRIAINTVSWGHNTLLTVLQALTTTVQLFAAGWGLRLSVTRHATFALYAILAAVLDLFLTYGSPQPYALYWRWCSCILMLARLAMVTQSFAKIITRYPRAGVAFPVGVMVIAVPTSIVLAWAIASTALSFPLDGKPVAQVMMGRSFGALALAGFLVLTSALFAVVPVPERRNSALQRVWVIAYLISFGIIGLGYFWQPLWRQKWDALRVLVEFAFFVGWPLLMNKEGEKAPAYSRQFPDIDAAMADYEKSVTTIKVTTKSLLER